MAFHERAPQPAREQKRGKRADLCAEHDEQCSVGVTIGGPGSQRDRRRGQGTGHDRQRHQRHDQKRTKKTSRLDPAPQVVALRQIGIEPRKVRTRQDEKQEPQKDKNNDTHHGLPRIKQHKKGCRHQVKDDAKRDVPVWDPGKADRIVMGKIPQRMERETQRQGCPMPKETRYGRRPKDESNRQLRPEHGATAIGGTEPDIGPADQGQCDRCQGKRVCLFQEEVGGHCDHKKRKSDPSGRRHGPVR